MIDIPPVLRDSRSGLIDWESLMRDSEFYRSPIDQELFRKLRMGDPMSLTRDDIDNRVGFHKATTDGPDATLPKHAELRHLFKKMMAELDQILPAGRAKSVCFERFEDTSMWAHKAVAQLAPVIPDEVKTPKEERMEEMSLKTFLHLKKDFLADGNRDFKDDMKLGVQFVAEGKLTREQYHNVFGVYPL